VPAMRAVSPLGAGRQVHPWRARPDAVAPPASRTHPHKQRHTLIHLARIRPPAGGGLADPDTALPRSCQTGAVDPEHWVQA